MKGRGVLNLFSPFFESLLFPHAFTLNVMHLDFVDPYTVKAQ
jgi:hypothetical protein